MVARSRREVADSFCGLKVFFDARQRRERRVIVERFAPLAEGLKQWRQLNLPKASRRLGKIPYSAFQHGSHTYAVSGGVMMKSHRARRRSELHLYDLRSDLFLYLQANAYRPKIT